MSPRGEQVAWEERWGRPTALATIVAIGLLVGSALVVRSLGGDGEAASLRDVYGHGSAITLSSLLQGAAFALLVVPLVYLFRAAWARSDRMRRQFLPLVIAAPLALAAASVVNGVAANEAASDFVAGKATTSLVPREATSDCRTEQDKDAAGFRDEFGAGAAAIPDCAARQLEDDEAKNAITDASMQRVAEVLQFGGALALAFGLLYSCLNAMRVGLLTRFWGSLGMALGVAAVLGLFQLTLIFFLYFALLAAGLVPGGKPPAWAAGEAIPWPTPGDKAAADLSPPQEDPPQANGHLPSSDEPEEAPEKGQSQ